jgi:hypothetical protein
MNRERINPMDPVANPMAAGIASIRVGLGISISMLHSNMRQLSVEMIREQVDAIVGFGLGGYNGTIKFNLRNELNSRRIRK